MKTLKINYLLPFRKSSYNLEKFIILFFAILLALSLFGCKKEYNRESKIVLIKCYTYSGSFNLKYKRLSGYCDTIITSSSYQFIYNCYVDELRFPVSMKTISTQPFDTLKIEATINKTVSNKAFVKNQNAEISIQPDQAL